MKEETWKRLVPIIQDQPRRVIVQAFSLPTEQPGGWTAVSNRFVRYAFTDRAELAMGEIWKPEEIDKVTIDRLWYSDDVWGSPSPHVGEDGEIDGDSDGQ